MASDPRFAAYVVDQLRSAGAIDSRRMFGEYAIYCDTRVVALVCDDQLFVKPTKGGREFIGTPTEAAPFPGAKMHFVVTEELDDSDWLCQLIRITARETPPPKPKAKRVPSQAGASGRPAAKKKAPRKAKS